jgi:hypothetical protein
MSLSIRCDLLLIRNAGFMIPFSLDHLNENNFSQDLLHISQIFQEEVIQRT